MSSQLGTVITRVRGREVIDSRGNPTIEAELTLSDGSEGRAIVPSGASKGTHEALELRDGDTRRFRGMGVQKAVQNVNETLAKLLMGQPVRDLATLDRGMMELDGTPQKARLGANAILSVSLAYAHALASSRKKPLFLVLNELMGLQPEAMTMPVPLMNILNGGQHADNGLEFQEFMIVPHGFSRFSEALRAGCEIFHTLKKTLSSKHLSTSVGDEGGFAPRLDSNEDALALIAEAVESAGYRLGSQVSVALDVAASSFYDSSEKCYRVKRRGKERHRSEELVELYSELASRYPIVSIEDGLDENDWDGWKRLTEALGAKTQLVGDDLFVTDSKRLLRGIESGIANSILIKVNQVGTLTETFETMALARDKQYTAVVSHRSGESEDVTIAHLAVGSGCGQIKTGSVSRGERTAKYNELLRIEQWAAEHDRPIAMAKPF